MFQGIGLLILANNQVMRVSVIHPVGTGILLIVTVQKTQSVVQIFVTTQHTARIQTGVYGPITDALMATLMAVRAVTHPLLF